MISLKKSFFIREDSGHLLILSGKTSFNPKQVENYKLVWSGGGGGGGHSCFILVVSLQSNKSTFGTIMIPFDIEEDIERFQSIFITIYSPITWSNQAFRRKKIQGEENKQYAFKKH